MIERMFSSITGQQQVTGDHRFVVECQPKQPETSSNLSVVCYANKNRRSALPIKVRWFRLKNNQLTEIVGMRGSTYPCEPSDLGCKIKAEITSLEDDSPGTAEAWFGPIRMDITIKQVLAGVLSTGHTSLSAFIIKEKQKEARLALSETDITITDIKSEKSFRFEYTLSQPRIEINPKDTTRLYLRFHKDGDDQLRTFLNSIFDFDMEKSTRSQSLELRNENKLQLKFISRSSRDLLIFGIKSFSAKRDMKSSAVIEKIERIDLTKEEMFTVFFQFQSLRSDMVRLQQLNRELNADRERKGKQLKDLEEEIASVTATYLKIIEDKCRDTGGLNQSYSQLSQKRDDIAGRNRMKSLEKENSELKIRIRDLLEEIEVLQFFRKGPNESVVHTQQSRPVANPFEKKPPKQDPKQSMNVIELSRINIRLLEENNRLKGEQSRFEKEKSKVEMFNLLDSLNDHQDEEAKVKLVQLQHAYSQLLVKHEHAQRQLDAFRQKQAAQLVSAPPAVHNMSLREESAILSSSMIDRSMTSEAEINLLLEKFNDLKDINDRLLAQNDKYGREKEQLRRENQRLSVELSQLRGDITRLNQQLLGRSNVSTTNSDIAKLTEQNEHLRDERRLLLKKLELIAGEAGKLKNQLELERRCQQLSAELKKAYRRIAELQQELIRGDRSLRMSQLVIDQSDKMKEINESLLNEINLLKRQNEHLKGLNHEQTVEILRKELFMLRQQLPLKEGVMSSTDDASKHAEELYSLQKKLDQYREDNRLLQIKLRTQTQTIQKMIHEMHDRSRSVLLDSSDRSKDKYRRKIKDLEEQIARFQRSSDALNRSQNLSRQYSIDVDQGKDIKIEELKQENEMILRENERISEMCEKYSKEAKDMQKLRHENIQLRQQLEKLQHSQSTA